MAPRGAIMSDFWARRKAAVRAEEEAEVRHRVAEEEAEARARLEEKPDGEILRELGLPEPDDMKAGDDFSAFLKTSVPERIRARALRRLWTTDPVLANLDGLVEYGEDFTDAATVVENLQTAYRVGRGMMRHIEELARAEAEAGTEGSGDEVDESVADAASDVTPTGKSDSFGRVEMPRHDDDSDGFSRAEMPRLDEKSEEMPQDFAKVGEKNLSRPRRMRYVFANGS